jgi:hypothetical protein
MANHSAASQALISVLGLVMGRQAEALVLTIFIFGWETGCVTFSARICFDEEDSASPSLATSTVDTKYYEFDYEYEYAPL